MRAEDNI